MVFVVFSLTRRLLYCLAVVCSCLCPQASARLLLPSRSPLPNCCRDKVSFALAERSLWHGSFPPGSSGLCPARVVFVGRDPSLRCLVLVPERNQQHMMDPETNQAPRCQGRSKGSGNLSFTCLQLILGSAAVGPNSLCHGTESWEQTLANQLGHGSAAAPTGLAGGQG